MPTYYAYLRVSRHTQEVASQRLGVLEYASRHNYSQLTIVEETASRAGTWRDRKIGTLVLETAQSGDVILTSEITRLGEYAWQMLEIMHEALKRGVKIIITKMDFCLDGGIHAQIFAAALGMASMLEREFLKARTSEGIQRAALEGRKGGRRKGSTGRLKLDSQLSRVTELHQLKLSAAKMAFHFGVTEKTMRKFLARHFPKTKE